MGYARPITDLRTHSVENQPASLEALNAFEADSALKEGVLREGGDWASAKLVSLGACVFDPEWINKANLANRFAPELKRFDRQGRRVDTVEFHPAYHDLMALAWRHEVHAMPWRGEPGGGHVARAAAEILFSQLECGVLCPTDIIYGIVPMLRRNPISSPALEALMVSTEYDPRPIPHEEKTSVTLAFTSTEKQGGSDIRGNTTFATPTGSAGHGNEYILNGHKWFCSAAGADVIFVVAQTAKGPGCFLVPRWLPDGRRNPISLERLKDKLGNKSNASAELEFENTHGWLIGDEGRGIPTVMEFMLHTRLGCALIPAGLMRQSLTQAIHHTRHRTAFQRKLIDQPLMRSVLADLALDSEAATTIMLRIARAFDRAATDEGEQAFARITVAVAKYWLNKRLVPFVHECLECQGGGGYIEESIMPRVYRESPLNGIWEGPGNVISLDILRALRKEPRSGEAFFAELDTVRGEDARLDQTADLCRKLVYEETLPEASARFLAEKMALAMQAALLIRHAPNAVADAFCLTRLEGSAGWAYGSRPTGVDTEAILQRAFPA